MKAAIINLISLVLISSPGFGQNIGNSKPIEREPAVDFFQEEIILKTSDSTMRIDGTYHFRNNTSRDMPLPVLFPFHVDSATAFPHHIEAYLLLDDTTEQRLQFSEIQKSNGIRVRIPLKAKSEVTWRLIYEQKIRSKRAVYIITSTAAWKKPLTEATYLFVASEDFVIDYIWPEPDTTYTMDGLIYRQCVRHDFMPSREMEIIWK